MLQNSYDKTKKKGELVKIDLNSIILHYYLKTFTHSNIKISSELVTFRLKTHSELVTPRLEIYSELVTPRLKTNSELVTPRLEIYSELVTPRLKTKSELVTLFSPVTSSLCDEFTGYPRSMSAYMLEYPSAKA